MNLAIWLERTAARHPNRQAIFLGSECLATYKEFWLAVCTLRSHLENEGIKDIYISSKTRKKLKPFYQNNFKKISTGINITFFKKLSIYYCRFKKLHLNIFFNNIIILALRI